MAAHIVTVMTKIEETLKIALEAHAGQEDLDGNPAILHPLAVGLMGNSDAEIKAGFLHDVVEDSSMTLEDLKNKGVEDEVIAALALLSHDKEKVGYFEYVEISSLPAMSPQSMSNSMTFTTICSGEKCLMKQPSHQTMRPRSKSLNE